MSQQVHKISFIQLELIIAVAPNWILSFLEAGDDYPENEDVEEDQPEVDEYRFLNVFVKQSPVLPASCPRNVTFCIPTAGFCFLSVYS